MFRKIAVAMLAGCFVLAAIATQAAMGYDDPSGESTYVAGAIGQTH